VEKGATTTAPPLECVPHLYPAFVKGPQPWVKKGPPKWVNKFRETRHLWPFQKVREYKRVPTNFRKLGIPSLGIRNPSHFFFAAKSKSVNPSFPTWSFQFLPYLPGMTNLRLQKGYHPLILRIVSPWT